jgi:catechol 2,3-dioxygenase-like lactoylglutathione lyase family enzyme
MLRIGSIVWGVRDVPRAIRFWCDALDYRPLREPSDNWAILVPRQGPGVQLAITTVSSQPRIIQRHHLDLYAHDQAAEVERLVVLGAQRVEWRYPQARTTSSWPTRTAIRSAWFTNGVTLAPRASRLKIMT